jgi:hypothetical protein
MIGPEPTTDHRPPITRWTVFRGLLWREWLLHRYSLSWMLSVWLIGVWIVPAFSQPPAIAIVGIVFAFMLAPSMAGGDAAEGSEEFAFALPFSRGESYLIRFAVGAVSLLLFISSAILLVACGVPRKAWGLLVETGFAEPLPDGFAGGMTIFTTIIVPLAIFAAIFWNAALCRTARAVSGSGPVALIGTLILLILVGSFDHYLRPGMQGVLTLAFALALAVGLPVFGYFRYGSKEVGEKGPQ